MFHEILLSMHTESVDSPVISRNNRQLSLAQFAPGQSGIIIKIDSCPKELKAKLCSMGLCPGHEVKVLYRAPLGDPITVQVLNSQLALRLSEATPIVVAPVIVDPAIVNLAIVDLGD